MGHLNFIKTPLIIKSCKDKDCLWFIKENFVLPFKNPISYVFTNTSITNPININFCSPVFSLFSYTIA